MSRIAYLFPGQGSQYTGGMEAGRQGAPESVLAG